MVRIKIADEYKWLYRVPKSAIIDFLKNDKSEDSVRKAIHILDDSASGKLVSLLVNFDYKQVIYVFQKCIETTPQEAKELYRRYRYRGMKTLHIYSRKGKCNLHSLNRSALNMVINTKVSELKDSSKKFCNLEIREIESIHEGSIRELSYTYHRFIQYMRTDIEYPDYVTDLRRGFIWIPYKYPWVCICAKDEIVAQILHDSLKQHFGFDSQSLPLTKTVQQGLESTEDMRKAGYISTGGTARRLTNPQMRDDHEAMEECRQRDNLDDRPLAGFNVESEGKMFSLTYNESGKIYFSIDLDVDQMRIWGVRKIREIVQFITDLKLTEPSSLFGVKLRALSGVGINVKPAIVVIASAIARCKNENVSDVPLKRDVFELATNLGTYIKTRFRIFCSTCNDYSEIVCDCGDIDNFSIKDGHIKCKTCDKPISKSFCFDGHKNHITQMENCIELLPLSRLNDLIVNIFKEATDLNFIASQESFSIKNDRLFYRHDASKTVYRINEIPQYKQGLLVVPEKEIPVIKKAFNDFREKCNKTGTENCAQCIQSNIGTKCYLRLFGLFDPNYDPRPHQGHEFGDYSTLVNIENKQKTMVIAMKSKTKRSGRTRKVTLRDDIGSDIFSQVGSYLHDGRMDVIGVCIPKKLEDGFAALLTKNAQDKNKKLLIIDDDDLVQIAYSVMQNNDMQLSEI